MFIAHIAGVPGMPAFVPHVTQEVLYHLQMVIQAMNYAWPATVRQSEGVVGIVSGVVDKALDVCRGQQMEFRMLAELLPATKKKTASDLIPETV